MSRDRTGASDIMLLCGTRPEGVKTAPLARLLCLDSRFTVTVVDTGQQPGRVSEALAPFGLIPNVTLRPQRNTGSLAELAAALTAGIDQVIGERRPAAVVVQGDTTTALVGGMVAFWNRVPVVHLEAGLRTGNLDQPFPEEANRAMIARFAALHLAPTDQARHNLLDEGIDPDTVIVTGNTVVDALQLLLRSGAAQPPDWTDPQRRTVVATLHRRENWGQGIRDAVAGLARIAHRCPDIELVMVAHPNPQLREHLTDGLRHVPNARITPPLSYPQMIGLLDTASLVITDSGGLQEEAATLGVPVVVTRDTTERPEAVQSGLGCLTGTDPRRIEEAAITLLGSPPDNTRASPFGDGRASQRAITAISNLLHLAPARRIPVPHRSTSPATRSRVAGQTAGTR
ncbi:UDP-N-acetylglucosamine 2-epimerase (non-hydrolyzing) [Micromonospora sp. NPDC126480]|uniref:non-hydrolyzing UDP-N-acetylglucosamine 2-epimerase n=1 Tax=Micromonospora sp. NPDC126480 TaxID=3155312 RepID=UPI00331DF642